MVADQLDVGELLDHPVDQLEERLGVELRLAVDVGALDPQAHLEVFLVADQGVELAGDLAGDLLAPLGAADRRPELGAVVQVERGDGAGGLGRLHPLDDQRGGRLRERREDAARVEPAHAPAEDACPVEVARLEQGAGLVRPVVEDDRGARP